MRKFATTALIVLVLVAIALAFYIFFPTTPSTDIVSTNYEELKTEIKNNSSWIYLLEEDFYGYLNGTYTLSIQTIIESLEEAIPVIIRTSNDKFGAFNNETFIVASSFDTSNQVYIYYYDENEKAYKKTLTSLEFLLENATAALIYNK